MTIYVPEQRTLVNAAEAAGMLAIGRSTFWAQVKAGNLPDPVKIGGATRWRIADLCMVGAPKDQAASVLSRPKI